MNKHRTKLRDTRNTISNAKTSVFFRIKNAKIPRKDMSRLVAHLEDFSKAADRCVGELEEMLKETRSEK